MNPPLTAAPTPPKDQPWYRKMAWDEWGLRMDGGSKMSLRAYWHQEHINSEHHSTKSNM
jgi:hypothetical protein